MDSRVTKELTETRKLVVIMPAFNEADQIGEALSRIDRIRPSLSAKGIRLLSYVIDDGSRDETPRRAEEAGADRILRHLTNQGLGAAVRTGLKAALDSGADIVVKIDSDLQHDAQDIEQLIEPILQDEADVVYGNRFERIDFRMSIIHKIGNHIFTFLMRWLTHWPLKDGQPGIFAINRSYLEVFHIPGDYNYTQQILLDAYHKGMRFAHLPVSFHQRTHGKSYVTHRYPFQAMMQIVMVLVGLKPLRVFMPIGLAFLLLGGGISGWEIYLWIAGQSHKPIVHVNLVLGSVFFGLQTCFFGILAQLIVNQSKK